MERTDSEYQPKDCWSVIESYFEDKHLRQLVKHQVESYNDFINNQIKKTVQMFNSLNNLQDGLVENEITIPLIPVIENNDLKINVVIDTVPTVNKNTKSKSKRTN